MLPAAACGAHEHAEPDVALGVGNESRLEHPKQPSAPAAYKSLTRAVLRPLPSPLARCTSRMFSGCRDEETSADVHDVAKFGLPDAEGAGGACTNAVLVNLVSVAPEVVAAVPLSIADDDRRAWPACRRPLKPSGARRIGAPRISLDRPCVLVVLRLPGASA